MYREAKIFYVYYYICKLCYIIMRHMTLSAAASSRRAAPLLLQPRRIIILQFLTYTSNTRQSLRRVGHLSIPTYYAKRELCIT